MHEVTVAFYANLEQLTALGSSFTLLEAFVVFLECARNKGRIKGGDIQYPDLNQVCREISSSDCNTNSF